MCKGCRSTSLRSCARAGGRGATGLLSQRGWKSQSCAAWVELTAGDPLRSAPEAGCQVLQHMHALSYHLLYKPAELAQPLALECHLTLVRLNSHWQGCKSLHGTRVAVNTALRPASSKSAAAPANSRGPAGRPVISCGACRKKHTGSRLENSRKQGRVTAGARRFLHDSMQRLQAPVWTDARASLAASCWGVTAGRRS